MATKKPTKEELVIDVDCSLIAEAIDLYIDSKIKEDQKNLNKKIIIQFDFDLNYESIINSLADRYESAGWTVLKNYDDNMIILV